MEISNNLYSYLVKADILSTEAARLSPNTVRLPSSSSLSLQNSDLKQKIAQLLKQLKSLKNDPLKVSHQGKESENYTQKPLSSDEKKQLIQDLEYFVTKLSENADNNGKDSSDSKQINSPKAKPSPINQSLNILKLNQDKDPLESSSSLELLTLLITQSFQLQPLQAASLFTENCRFLANVLVKGIKGVFAPVLILFRKLIKLSNYLAELCAGDLSLVHFSLNVFRPGLFSKSEEVSSLAIDLFIALGEEFIKRGLKEESWKWLIGENNNGLLACLKSLKRHPLLGRKVLQVLITYGEQNMLDLFTLYLQIEIPDQVQYIEFIGQLITYIASDSTFLQKLQAKKVLKDWLEGVLLSITQDFAMSLRATSLSFLVEFWIKLPEIFEEQKSNCSILIQNLVSNCKEIEESYLLAITSATQLFRLLSNKGTIKNTSAPGIYKKLSDILAQTLSYDQMREFLLLNFIDVFKQLPSIPIEIVLEPYITSILSQETYFIENLNMYDFEFLSYASENSEMSEPIVLLVLELLAKSFLHRPLFFGLISNTLDRILHAYSDILSVKEFICTFTKTLLAVFFASEKCKKMLPGSQNQEQKSQGIALSPEELENEMLNAAKREKIVKLLISIANLKQMEVIQRIRPLVAHTAIQLEDSFKVQSKGMVAILQILGEPEQILNEYRQELVSRQKQSSVISEQLEQEDKPSEEIQLSIVTNQISQEDELLQQKKKIQSKETILRVSRMLEDKRREFSVKKESKKKQIEDENNQIKAQKKRLRMQLEERRLGQGVSQNNVADQQVNLLFEFNSISNQDIKQSLNLQELNRLENRDKRMLYQSQSKIRPLLRVLFAKYANSCNNKFLDLLAFSTEHYYFDWIVSLFCFFLSVPRFENQIVGDLFDHFKDNSSGISVPEVWKMLKDYELTEICSKTNLQGLFRKIAHEASCLNFNEFETLMLELAILLCQNPPNDKRHLPVSCSLDYLFETMKQYSQKLGLSSLLLDEFAGMPSIIRDLSKKLDLDSQAQLPPGFKMVPQKELRFSFSLPESLSLSKGVKYAYEILNDIFIEHLKVTIIEPKAFDQTVLKLEREKKQPKQLESIQDRKRTEKTPEKLQINLNEQKLSPMSPISSFCQPLPKKKRVLQIENFKQLPVELRALVSEANPKISYTAQQVANVLDDIIDAVENQKTVIRKQGIRDRAREEKEEQDRIKSEAEREQRQRMKERKALLMEKLIKDKALKIEMENKQKEQEQKEEKARKENEILSEKKKASKLKDMRNQVERFRQKKLSEKDQEMKEKERVISEELKKKKINFKEFNRERMHQIRDETNKRKAASEEKINAAKKVEEKIKQRAQTVYKAIVLKDQNRRNQAEKYAQQITQLIVNSDMKRVLVDHETQLSWLFDFLDNSTFKDVARPGFTQQPELPFNTFSSFCFKFNICPQIISIKQATLVFLAITKAKSKDYQGEVGLNKQEFYEALIRISVKGASYLNAKIKESKLPPNQDLEVIDQEQQNSPKQSPPPKLVQKNSQEIIDNYSQVEETTTETLEELIKIIGVPMNRVEANHYFKGKVLINHSPIKKISNKKI